MVVWGAEKRSFEEAFFREVQYFINVKGLKIEMMINKWGTNVAEDGEE